MYMPHFVFPSSIIHSHLLTTVNDAAVNVGEQSSVAVLAVISVGSVPRVDLLDRMYSYAHSFFLSTHPIPSSLSWVYWQFNFTFL